MWVLGGGNVGTEWWQGGYRVVARWVLGGGKVGTRWWQGGYRVMAK